MKILITVLLLLPTISFANDTFIDLHLTSHHNNKPGYFDKRTGEYTIYNNENYGLGITHQVDDFLDIRVGFFKNSHYRTAYFAGIQPSTYIFENSGPLKYRIGVTIGLTSGYHIQQPDSTIGNRSNLIGWPNLAIGYKNLFVNIGYIPGVVQTLSLQYKF